MEKIDDLYKLNCIIIGEERENYDMWLENASTVVKCSFAEHGYYPERLIHDESFDVRKAIIQYSSDYCAKYARYLLDDELNDNQYWGIFNLCMRCPGLDEETLTKLLEKQNGEKPFVHSIGNFYGNGFDAKYAGYRHQMTALDKTMTVYQLYQTGSPAWVRDFSVDTICNVQHAESALQNMVGVNQVPFELFNDIAIEPKNAMEFSRCVEHVNDYARKLQIFGCVQA